MSGFESEFFHQAEFDCHDGTPYPEELVDFRLKPLASMLDIIRYTWGDRLKVVSGYRTVSYNHLIGGAPHSKHLEGDAADIKPLVGQAHIDVEVKRLHQQIHALLANGKLPLVGGIGYYPGKWIHIDTRPKPANGHVALWFGVGIGSEVA